jgi:hypothetical protein
MPVAGWSRTVRMLPVAVVAVMALWASSAHASSIAFLRGGNIWIAAPDGSHATPLTSGGGYTYVSASKATGTMLLAYRAGASMGVISADGTGQRQIAAPRGLATAPDVDAIPRVRTWRTRRSRGSAPMAGMPPSADPARGSSARTSPTSSTSAGPTAARPPSGPAFSPELRATSITPTAPLRAPASRLASPLSRPTPTEPRRPTRPRGSSAFPETTCSPPRGARMAQRS